MANSVDPDQTAPIGAVCSGSTLFASILLKFVSNVRQLFAVDDFSRRHFQMHIFLGALKVNQSHLRITFVLRCEIYAHMWKKRWVCSKDRPRLIMLPGINHLEIETF